MLTCAVAYMAQKEHLEAIVSGRTGPGVLEQPQEDITR